MIKPNMATMLAFVFSDIRVEATLQRQLEDVVSQSFNRITVTATPQPMMPACLLPVARRRL